MENKSELKSVPARRTYSKNELAAMDLDWQETQIRRGDSTQQDHRGLAMTFLPKGATLVGFDRLALDLAADPRGYALLTGWENGPAGLEIFRDRDSEAQSLSFCVNGATYTAFEDPEDGYRSSLGSLVRREGNWCATRFEPCALVPSFRSTQGAPLAAGDPYAKDAEVLTLLVPGGDKAVLSVGTNHHDDYYPCFVAHCDAQALTYASSMGIALAHELDEQVLVPASKSGVGRGRPRV